MSTIQHVVDQEQVTPRPALQSRWGFHSVSYQDWLMFRRLNHLVLKTRHRVAAQHRFDRKTVNKGVLWQRVYGEGGKMTGWKRTDGGVKRPDAPSSYTIVERPIVKWEVFPELNGGSNLHGYDGTIMKLPSSEGLGYPANYNWANHPDCPAEVRQRARTAGPNGGVFKVKIGSTRKPALDGPLIDELKADIVAKAVLSGRRPSLAPVPALDPGIVGKARGWLQTLEDWYAGK